MGHFGETKTVAFKEQSEECFISQPFAATSRKPGVGSIFKNKKLVSYQINRGNGLK